MKVTVFIATSLDGFIARKNGDIDWLMKAQEKATGEDFGYDDLIQSIDYLVMGRGSFEAVLKFPEWPYYGTKVIVLSRTIKALPQGFEGKAELYNGSIEGLHNRFKREQCKGIYIDGGKTVQSFIMEGIVTDIIVTKIPVLIGDGIPLFGNPGKDISLNLVEAKGYTNGFVQLHYRL